jgi:3-oxoacyl-[acyl-carrier protein] reductase
MSPEREVFAMLLENEVAVVTGAGKGLGRAFALALAKEGAKVTVAEADPSTGEKVVEEIGQLGGTAIFIQVDVSQKIQVEAMVQKTIEAFGRIDILVNNAGITKPAMINKISEDDWDRIYAVNVKGTFLCIQAVLPYMREHKSGCIINLTSGAGLVGDIGQLHYSSSKAAIAGITRSAARELARYNIRVNAVSPVAMTDTTRKVLTDPKFKEKYFEMIPLRRVAEPEEIAPAIVFLASGKAGYITGQILPVDGGRTIR